MSRSSATDAAMTLKLCGRRLIKPLVEGEL
jgi:hypothetical protein